MEEIPLIEELKNLEELQRLIDMLLQIKPRNELNMNITLILEAMDCIMDEILEVYGKFRKEVNRVLVRVCDMGGKEEANIGLDIVRKTQLQGEKLISYFDFCKEIGVLNHSGCPKIVRFNDEEIEELKRILKGGDEKAIVVRDDSKKFENGLKTVITDQWEVFLDDIIVEVEQKQAPNAILSILDANNPFLDESYSIIPYNPVQNYDFPDLISL
ncbi:clathrin assembly protein [Trifolium pratense]|nr:clathrin assembly protein [Trifolium pratense]